MSYYLATDIWELRSPGFPFAETCSVFVPRFGLFDGVLVVHLYYTFQTKTVSVDVSFFSELFYVFSNTFQT